LRRATRYFISLVVYAIASLILLIQIPRDPKNDFLFGFSITRLVMILGFSSIILLLILFLLRLRQNKVLQLSVQGFFNGSMKGHNLPVVLYLLLLIFLIFSAFFFIGWIVYFDRLGAIFLRLSPLAMFIALLSVHGLLDTSVYLPDFLNQLRVASGTIQAWSQKYKISWLLIALLSIFVGNSYYQLSIQHAQEINQHLQFSDQKSYLVIAEKAYQTSYQYMGDRNRTPLYSYLLTTVYKPGLDREMFFERSKQLSILLSMGLLILLFLTALKFLPAWQSASLTMISATSLYVYKAGYVQPELMYYTFSFASFVLMIWMMLRPSIWLGIITGAVVALAFYTKASIMPGLILVVVLYLIQGVVDRYQKKNEGTQTDSVGGYLRIKIMPVIMVVIVFLGLLSPYLLDNKRIFGRYFYNVNTTFYLWYDSWDEVKAGTGAHGDHVGWPDLPPEQIPSPGKYLREHTSQQILQRFALGIQSQWNNILTTYSQFSFPVIYTIVLVVFAFISPKESLRLVFDYKFVVLYCLGYFLGYLILYAWFAPVAGLEDARFTYSLYVPYLFSIFAALKMIVSRVKSLRIGTTTIQTKYLLWAVHLSVLFLAFITFYQIAPTRLAKRWYGK